MRMSNELAWFAPVDAVEINLTEEADLLYWTQAMGCSTHELIKAVQSVVIAVVAIKGHLKQRSAVAALQ